MLTDKMVESIIADVWDNIESDVITAYFDAWQDMDEHEPAPDLVDITNWLYLNIADNIADLYEHVFGEDEYIREDWLIDLGIDKDGIPGILPVCRVLNAFRLGYSFRGVLYNTTPTVLLREREVE